MTSFVSRLFTVSSFESDFPLVLDVDGEKGKKIVMPEGIRYRKQTVTFIMKFCNYIIFYNVPYKRLWTLRILAVYTTCSPVMAYEPVHRMCTRITYEPLYRT